jgi:eukaryotic-like serine/threonine-protein kinase
MSYCINPECNQRQNPNEVANCQTCATPLLILDRYQLIRPLRDRTLFCNAEVFEVEDRQSPGAIKILKVLINEDRTLVRLFQQEQNLLTNPKLHHAGIPRGEAAFAVLVAGRELRCLVMERIDGQDLEQWLHHNGTISEAQARNWLQQIAEILVFVHSQRLFHRDIKPANIMRKANGRLVLIDFGTARQVTATVTHGHQGTRVSSYGYTAPEQEQGRAVPQSDLYALGQTFIHLLTGKHPASPELENQLWCNLTPYPLSRSLVHLIDRLVQFQPRKRPRHAQAVLWQLEWLELRRYWRWFGAAIVLSSLAGWAFGKYNVLEQAVAMFVPPPACDQHMGDTISCGEEILTPAAVSPEKREAVAAWKAGDYAEAFNRFNDALRLKKNDPEAMIYRNNAKIMWKKYNAKTIAIVVPLNSPDESSYTGLDMLRGAAQAQSEAIEQGIYFKVVIGDDANDVKQAQKVATALGKKSAILATVGHYASETTQAVLPIYRDSQLVLIASTSTSEELSKWGTEPRHIFFRTVSTTQRAAQALTGHLQRTLPDQKVAVFYNQKSEFSRSLKDQFSLILREQIIELPQEFDLTRSDFNPKAALDQVKQAGGKAIAIFPDGHTDPNAFKNALKLLSTNQGQKWVLGGDTLYSNNTLVLGGNSLYSSEVLKQINPDILKRLVVTVPWHYLNNSAFSQSARNLWGGNVSWRTATSYDAVRVIWQGLEKQPHDRRALQVILAAPDFAAKGATGEIHFTGGDRREPLTTLVKVMSCPPSSFIFVPLNIKSCPTE